MTFSVRAPHRIAQPATRRVNQRGVALLEVVLAMALLVVAVAVFSSGINASFASLERQRHNTHAANLAASILAEVQLGIRSNGFDGPQPFEPPFQDWTWEVALTPTETELGEVSGLVLVEAIIRRTGTTTVQRLAQVMPPAPAAPLTAQISAPNF